MPAASTALTEKVWFPSDKKSGDVHGLEQAANAPESMLHSKVPPASVELNVNVGLTLFEGLVGLSTRRVSGDVVSTTQE